jgi:allantoate deiminase
LTHRDEENSKGESRLWRKEIVIDGDRLWDRLMELSSVGKQDSRSVTRLSFSEEERVAKDLVTSFMEEAGLSVREDAVGNLIGRKEAVNQNAPVVLVGSHLDSVYNGGSFDGPLGVLAGIEILQTMNERRVQTECPIEVIAFTDEEGARFSFGMIGSRALAGTLTRENLQHEDEQGISIAEAMRNSGLDPDSIGDAARPTDSIQAYVELHIEQGKILENENLPVGIVTGIAGPLWLQFVLEGEAGHAGTTPMNLRRDALATAAHIMRFIESEASETGSTVGTVGQLNLSPGGVNIIPGRVEFSLDLRDINEQVRDEVEQRIVEEARRLCGDRGIGLSIETLQRVAPAPCSELVQNSAKAACEELGLKPYFLASGAGHDGMQLKDVCPMGMIFARSKGGISHNPAEWSSKEDCAQGANVLYHTVVNLAVQH